MGGKRKRKKIPIKGQITSVLACWSFPSLAHMHGRVGPPPVAGYPSALLAEGFQTLIFGLSIQHDHRQRCHNF